MNFEFFDAMSMDEARGFLDAFLKTESATCKHVEVNFRDFTDAKEFSIGSISPILRNIIQSLSTFPIDPDDNLPEWIRDLPSYSKGLFEFDEHSKASMLFGAYYLGESFVRSVPTLSWKIGHPETALKNMPVVGGFRRRLEMGPILVVENVSNRILADGADESVIESTVAEWFSMVVP